MIAAVDDSTRGYCASQATADSECLIGPWSLHLLLRADDSYEGVLVAHDGSVAEELRLERDGSFLRLREQVTLIHYTYDWHVVPGVCLTPRGTRFQLADDTHDGVADRLLIDGHGRSLGLVSSDYDTECGEEEPELRLEGELPARSPATLAGTDPLEPVLFTPELWRSGGAVLDGATIPDAAPITVGPATRAFASPRTVAPGSSLRWVWQGLAFDDEARRGEATVTFDPWPLITDGSFEGDAPVADDDDELLPLTPEAWEEEGQQPLLGDRSLLLSEGGAVVSFRLLQPAGTTRLHFLSDIPAFRETIEGGYGLFVQVAPVGGEIGANAISDSAPCTGDEPWCGDDSSVQVWRVSIDIPEAEVDREVLVRLTNRWADYGTVPASVVVDELRFE